jgi:hypothetical protein
VKHTLPALVIIWLLGGAPFTVFAQSPELMSAYRQFSALYDQGKYAEAEYHEEK